MNPLSYRELVGANHRMINTGWLRIQESRLVRVWTHQLMKMTQQPRNNQSFFSTNSHLSCLQFWYEISLGHEVCLRRWVAERTHDRLLVALRALNTRIVNNRSDYYEFSPCETSELLKVEGKGEDEILDERREPSDHVVINISLY